MADKLPIASRSDVIPPAKTASKPPQVQLAGRSRGDLAGASPSLSIPARSNDPANVPSHVGIVLKSPGSPLEPDVSERMKTHFGHDFSSIRVHADSSAAESAKSARASAYTVGEHLVFSANRFQPRTNEGIGLLAHELVHVVQQRRGASITNSFGRGSASGEHEADIAADAIVRGGPAVVTESLGVRPMLKEEEEDGDVKELKMKVSKLVGARFGGDYKKAFDAYDANKDGSIDGKELGKLLEDADVGNRVTRGAWVNGIIKRLDTNKNGKIEWLEFEAKIK